MSDPLHASTIPGPSISPAEPQASASAWPGPALAALGLAAWAAALVRTHALLSGADPPAGAFVAAAMLAGLALGGRIRLATTQSMRLAVVAAVACMALESQLAPGALRLLTGWTSLAVVAALAALPALLIGAAGTLHAIRSAVPIEMAGVGIILASLAGLPWLGPSLTGLVGALFVLAALRVALGGRIGERADERLPVLATAMAFGGGALLAHVPHLTAVDAPGPWPLAGTCAGVAVLFAAAFARVRNPLVRAVLALAAAVPLFPVGASLARTGLAHLMGNTVFPTVGPVGGTLGLLATALLFAAPAGALVGCVLLGPKRGPMPFVGGAAAGLVVAATAAWLWPSHAVSPPDRDTGARVVRAYADGEPVATASAATLPADLLPGHLAALAPPTCRHVLLVGSGTSRVVSAIFSHGGIDVTVVEPARSIAVACAEPHGDRSGPYPVAASPAAWPRREGGWDALIVQADAPLLPAVASLFTPEAAERARDLLAPGGLFIERVDAAVLGPVGLLQEAARVREAFPQTLLSCADMGRTPYVNVVGLVGDPRQGGGTNARLPWDRLDLDPAAAEALPAAARESMIAALLVQPGDLVQTFVAGPAELDALSVGLSAADPWRPGSDALRYPAAPSVARAFVTSLLRERLATVRLEVAASPTAGAEGGPQAWRFLGLATDLDARYSPPRAEISWANRWATWMNSPGSFRDEQRRMTFTRPKGTITVTGLPMTVADENTLRASMRGLWSDDVKRSGTCAVGGHPALWILVEPSAEKQSVVITWHCPVEHRLYSSSYELEDGKPGEFDEPLRFLATHVHCLHPLPPRPEAATPSAAAVPAPPRSARAGKG